MPNPAQKAPKGLADFTGIWRIERDIENAIGPDAQFSGQAHFTALPAPQLGQLNPQAPCLKLRETGEMTFADQPTSFAATRHYYWQEGPQNAAAQKTIHVYYDDGRFFHHFDPQDLRATAHHDCPPDVYDVTYDFAHWPNWQAIWQVSGPKKSYCLRSRYFRDADNA
jgi:hypothetical protein